MIRSVAAICLLSLASCQPGGRVVANSENQVPETEQAVAQKDDSPFKTTTLGQLKLPQVKGGTANVLLNETSSQYFICVEFGRSDSATWLRIQLELSCWLLTDDGNRVNPGQGIPTHEAVELGGKSEDRSWVSFTFRRTPDLGNVSAFRGRCPGRPDEIPPSPEVNQNKW